MDAAVELSGVAVIIISVACSDVSLHIGCGGGGGGGTNVVLSLLVTSGNVTISRICSVVTLHVGVGTVVLSELVTVETVTIRGAFDALVDLPDVCVDRVLL